MALNPLAMDMMLPALPDIASAFDITIANKPQAVLSTFLMGLGVGQFSWVRFQIACRRAVLQHGALLDRQRGRDRRFLVQDVRVLPGLTPPPPV